MDCRVDDPVSQRRDCIRPPPHEYVRRRFRARLAHPDSGDGGPACELRRGFCGFPAFDVRQPSTPPPDKIAESGFNVILSLVFRAVLGIVGAALSAALTNAGTNAWNLNE